MQKIATQLPKLIASVLISDDLNISAFVDCVPLSSKLFDHLLASTSFHTITKICNILAFCKNMSKENFQDIQDEKLLIKLAINVLARCIILITTSENSTFLGLVRFVTEQLKLMLVEKSGQRFSLDLLTAAFLWKHSSTSLFKKLGKFFISPSIRRLQQLSCDYSVEKSTIDLQYLKQRTADFSENEKTVTLLIDEVYTAQRVEYHNGAFIGITNEGERV